MSALRSLVEAKRTSRKRCLAAAAPAKRGHNISLAHGASHAPTPGPSLSHVEGWGTLPGLYVGMGSHNLGSIGIGDFRSPSMSIAQLETCTATLVHVRCQLTGSKPTTDADVGHFRW